MIRCFTHWWNSNTFRDNRRTLGAGEPLRYVTRFAFNPRMSSGDIIYVTSIRSTKQGEPFRLHLIGKMRVATICRGEGAASILRVCPDDLDASAEYALASDSTPLRFDLQIPTAALQRLRWIDGGAPMPLTNYWRDPIELTEPSATILDALLPAMKPVSLSRAELGAKSVK